MRNMSDTFYKRRKGTGARALTIWFDQADAEAIEHAAKKERLTPTAYVRRAVVLGVQRGERGDGPPNGEAA